MLEIIGVKTNGGYYLNHPKNSYGAPSLLALFINGDHPKPTFHERWVFVTGEPTTVEKPVSIALSETITDDGGPYIG